MSMSCRYAYFSIKFANLFDRVRLLRTVCVLEVCFAMCNGLPTSSTTESTDTCRSLSYGGNKPHTSRPSHFEDRRGWGGCSLKLLCILEHIYWERYKTFPPLGIHHTDCAEILKLIKRATCTRGHQRSSVAHQILYMLTIALELPAIKHLARAWIAGTPSTKQDKPLLDYLASAMYGCVAFDHIIFVLRSTKTPRTGVT